MNEYDALIVKGTEEIIAEKVAAENEVLDAKETLNQLFKNSLAGHITHTFQHNKDARQNSGIEREMFDSLRAYNGEYSPDDKAKIIQKEGGSVIYMNVTATKCRVACSWIRDILQNAKFKPYRLMPTPVPDLPEELRTTLTESINKEFAEKAKEMMAPTEEGQEAQPLQAEQAQKTVREMNQKKRDIEQVVFDEIDTQALHEVKKMERMIDDQFTEGKWNQALAEFIEDFVVFPTAFMKGPIITKKNKLTWQGGKPVISNEYCYLNKRVSPFDMYPDPNAKDINDGNLIEHVRFSRLELSSLKGVKGYKTTELISVLENFRTGDNGYGTFNSTIESEKAEEEKRGTEYEANKGVIHGLHFFGTAPVKYLKDWGLAEDQLTGKDDTDEVEVEAILIGPYVIKCIINKDPLGRRPYFKASWQNRPGSFWGRSLPNIMSDNQRMCNATARALANNMGISAGPQVEVYTDRLADKGAIGAIEPFKIWQVTSDPTGGSGRAVTFTHVPSNADELLAVYEKFEAKADDVTGIPKYAYGNEKLGQAATTATGLSMILESSSKSIKDAVRHIDDGLIKPRVEYQFYWNMIENEEDMDYTGDICVIAMGSAVLTVKGAEQMRRSEFLGMMANPIYQEIIGMEGMADIIRDMADDLNFAKDIVPNRLEIKDIREKKEEAEARAAEQGDRSLQATKIQIDGQKEMHAGTLELNKMKLELEAQNQKIEQILKSQELKRKDQTILLTEENKRRTEDSKVRQKDIAQKRDIALKLQQDKKETKE